MSPLVRTLVRRLRTRRSGAAASTGAHPSLAKARAALLVVVHTRPRRVSPRGGWGGPVALVTVGAAVSAVTALPALDNDVPTTMAQVQAGFGLDADRTSSSGRARPAATASFDARADRLQELGATTRTSRSEGFGVTAVLADATSVAATGPRVTAATDVTSLSSNGIPEHTLRAYQAAAAALAGADPTCRLDWALLAGIGRVESNHGRFAGAIVSTAGISVPAVIGIRLDGTTPKTAVIVDSDGGRLDGDTAYDRAVGPMQFLPGSWVVFGADGDGDGVRNPQDIDDAALAAGAFLCSGVVDLSTTPGASAAIRRYNNSGEYVALVLSLAETYRESLPVGAIPVVAPVDSVPVQPTIPVAPAAPRVVLGLPADPSFGATPGTDVPSPGSDTPSAPTDTTTGATTTATTGSSLNPSTSSTSEPTTSKPSTSTAPTPGTGAPTSGSTTGSTTTTGAPSTGPTSGSTTGTGSGTTSSGATGNGTTTPSGATTTATSTVDTSGIPATGMVDTSGTPATSTTVATETTTTPADQVPTGP